MFCSDSRGNVIRASGVRGVNSHTSFMDFSHLKAFPTIRQIEIFYVLHQMRTQQYECVTDNLGRVVISGVTRSREIILDSDQMSMTAAQGYRTAMGTHGVEKGTYYYECQFSYPNNCVDDPLHPTPYTPQVRVGFATPAAHLDGPVGFDNYGFAIRSVDRSLCTNRERLFESEEYKVHTLSSDQVNKPILPGQVIGCLIHIPDYTPENPLPPETEMCESKQSARVSSKNQEDVYLPQQIQH